MSKKRKISAILLTAMTLLLLGGCGKKFDAAGYTQALLDVSYKNETDKYIELTGSSKEAAEKIFEKRMDITMEGFESLDFPDELEEKFRSLFENLTKNVKYSVGEAVEDKEGNFTVVVSIEPVTLFDDTYDEFQKQAKDYATKVANEVMNGKEMPSDKDMQNSVYELYYDILKKTVDGGIQYGEVQNITVHVNKTEGNIYEIPEDDMTAMDKAMISREVVE